LLAVGGVAYPFLVYYGIARLSPWVLIAVALALLLVRIALTRRGSVLDAWLAPLVVGGAGLAVLALLNPPAAVKAYPVMMSLAAASAFGMSLRRPPSLIERFARLREPDLPPAGVAYTRKLTMVWTVVLLANAAVAAGLGIWGSLAVWTLWNGLLAYLVMGTLFAGELVYRHFVRLRGTGAP
jgi:uncharacterized membrane protein